MIGTLSSLGLFLLAFCPQDYNHTLAQKRAGRSSKSKALVLKMNKPAHGEGWELGEGRTVKDDIDLRYDGGMDVDFEVTDDGHGVFSGERA